MHGSGRPVAIINNRSVKVGQTVNNAKVIRISQFSVELERDGQRFLVGVSTPAARRQSETSDQDEAEPAPDAEPEEQES